MADGWWWDKGRLDHVAHEQVADPLGVLPVSLVALLRLGVLGMCQCYQTGLFEDVEDGIQNLPADSIQTSLQPYLSSQRASSCNPLEKDEKRA